MKKINNKTTIEKFKKIHNNKYDYSLVDYKNMKIKIKIKCKEHGVFEQTPDKHLRGQGCKQCGFDNMKSKQRSTTKEFIEKAKNIHGDNYDYSKVNYINNSTKVEIICQKHGSFYIRPNQHLKGHGCPKCGIVKRTKSQSYNLDTFINKSKEVHDDEYDYSKSVYINSTTPITIICKEHGEFYPTATAHIQGSKCPICQTKRIGKEQRITKEDFIAKAIKVHNNIYDYSKIDYQGNKVPITVICKEHGEFKVRPDNHVNNMTGCPRCNESKGERKIATYLDSLNIKYIREYRLKGSKYRYDFYIPKLNLLIEYDGIQHFKPVSLFGGMKGFKETLKRDKMKNILAKNNNHNLIRLHYLRINDLEKHLLYKLSLIYKYKVSNKFYKNLVELCKGERLPGTTKPKDVRQFLLFKK